MNEIFRVLPTMQNPNPNKTNTKVNILREKQMVLNVNAPSHFRIFEELAIVQVPNKKKNAYLNSLAK